MTHLKKAANYLPRITLWYEAWSLHRSTLGTYDRRTIQKTLLARGPKDGAAAVVKRPLTAAAMTVVARIGIHLFPIHYF